MRILESGSFQYNNHTYISASNIQLEQWFYIFFVTLIHNVDIFCIYLLQLTEILVFIFPFKYPHFLWF